jgi:CHASE2 domain-containing sensor protein
MSQTRRFLFASMGFRVFALVVLAMLVLGENAYWHPQEEDCTGQENRFDELSSLDYMLMIRLTSFHEPNDQMVRIITLTPGEEPNDILYNVCEQRKFLTKLIHKLKSSEVHVIVLDKKYEASCAGQPDVTKGLADAIAQGASSVVIGRGTKIVPRSEQIMMGKRRVCLKLTPQVEFESANYGLIRIDSDTRRAPLEWPTFVESTRDPKLLPSLALVAAERANPNLKTRRRLVRILQSGKQPFVRFNPTNTFPKLSAIHLLCGMNATSNTDWGSCTEKADSATAELQGKIVLLGDYLDSDKHESVLGPVYGVDLQANYIAALLADDLYKPIGGTFSKAIYVTVWLVLVQFIFIMKPLGRAFLTCIGLWIAVFVVSLLLLTYFGYLFTFWFQGINLVVIPLTLVEHWLHGMAPH